MKKTIFLLIILSFFSCSSSTPKTLKIKEKGVVYKVIDTGWWYSGQDLIIILDEEKYRIWDNSELYEKGDTVSFYFYVKNKTDVTGCHGEIVPKKKECNNAKTKI